MSRLPLGFVVLSLVTGCYPAKTVTLTSADLRVPQRTRMTALMQSSAGTESLPRGFSRELILDEATIVRHDPKRTCVALVIRTGADLDAPLSEWLIEINGDQARVTDETSSVNELPYTEEQSVISAQRATPNSAANFNWTKPVEKVFRIHERRGTACGASLNEDGDIDVLVRNRIVQGQEWFERFTWTVQ